MSNPQLLALLVSGLIAIGLGQLATSLAKPRTRPSKLGGMVVFVAVVGGLVTAALLTEGSRGIELDGTTPLVALLLGPYLMGLHDDYTDSSPRLRLALLLLFASVAWSLGIRIDSVALPGIDAIQLESLSLPATILWIVGMTVAFNFIDGLDGLASGLGLTACAALCAMSAEGPGMWATASLAGALSGILLYNRPEATVVLGNSGSNLLGFALGIATLLCCTSSPGTFDLVPAVLVATVPILDAGLTLLRRAYLGQGLFRSDLGHLHHRLLSRGLQVQQALFVLLGAAAMSGFGAVIVAATTRLLQHNATSAMLQPHVLSSTGLLLATMSVAWVLRVTGWLRWAPLSELATGPTSRASDLGSTQDAARPG
ncbi:MAG TPA: hypothetical protein DIU15_18375 [Deltaproteobacteria bacterium]|nr:hypothetical protein [Deltaproteobacteria bacterium]